jgi:hypothetical protein
MTKKQSEPTITKQANKPAAELSDKELSQASGGAYDAFVPTDSFQGVRADKNVVGDGSVKTNSALIGLLKKP